LLQRRVVDQTDVKIAEKLAAASAGTAKASERHNADHALIGRPMHVTLAALSVWPRHELGGVGWGL